MFFGFFLHHEISNLFLFIFIYISQVHHTSFLRSQDTIEQRLYNITERNLMILYKGALPLRIFIYFSASIWLLPKACFQCKGNGFFQHIYMHVVIMPQIVSKVEICKTKLWIPKTCHVCVCVWKRSPSFMSFCCACCLYFPTRVLCLYTTC